MAEARQAWVRRWQAALSDAPARARVAALLEGSDAMALIRSLPAEDLYVVLREVGLADAAEVVARCSREQLQSFMDLDVWKADRFDAARYAPWILALRRGGCSDIPGMLSGVDPELQALALKQLIAVQELEEDEDPDPIGVFVMDTPDRRYRVSALSEDEGILELVRTQLGAMLARGPIHLSAYLSQVAWEMPAQLEEQAYRFRRARLADLGFPDPDDARILEAPLPSVDDALAAAGGPVSGEPDSAFARALIVRGGGGGLLQRALAAIDDALLAARVAQDLVHLSNALLVLWQVDPGEATDVREAAGRAMAMIELALRSAGGDDPSAAAAILAKTPARTLYRVAVTLLHDLHVRAERLLALAHRLPHEDLPILQALAARPPRRPGGEPMSRPAQLAEAEAQVAGLEELAGWIEGVPDPISALQAYGSVVVRRNLGLGDDAAPVSPDDFGRFLTTFGDDLFDDAEGLADARLRAEWVGLWGQGAPDLRYVGGVWLAQEDES